MGAVDLLAHLQCAGFALRVEAGKLVVSPSSALTDEGRLSIRQHRDALIGVLSGEHDKPAIAAEKPSQPRPHKLTREQLLAAHAEPWGEAVIARFQARTAVIQRHGFAEQDAEDLAEHLHWRDADGDDRVLCVECQHHRPGRCGNHRMAGPATFSLPASWSTTLQRCPGFQP